MGVVNAVPRRILFAQFLERGKFIFVLILGICFPSAFFVFFLPSGPFPLPPPPSSTFTYTFCFSGSEATDDQWLSYLGKFIVLLLLLRSPSLLCPLPFQALAGKPEAQAVTLETPAKPDRAPANPNESQRTQPAF